MFRLCTLAVLALLVAACSRGAGGSGTDDVQITLAISPSPPVVGPAQLTVHLTDLEGAPISGATVEIEGNMSHAGMQPVFVETSEGEPGAYVSQNFEFTMGGDWIITISGELTDGAEFRQTFDLRGVSS